MSKIAVVGAGHVGLVTAAGLAEMGHDVTAVDLSERLVARLLVGNVPFHEPGLEALVVRGLDSGRLYLTIDYGVAIPGAEFVFLCVDTPPTSGGAADLRRLRAAAQSISATLDGGAPLVVNKSTSPIGTGETIEDVFRAALGDRLLPRLVSNPEFLRQGSAVRDFFAPDRVVVGSRSGADARAVAALYVFAEDVPVVVVGLRTAEMIKYAANSFLAARISFVNEIARICEHVGVDVDEVMAGVSLDARIGRSFLQPGIGYGGSCFPKDVAALRYLGEAAGVATPVLAATQEVNQAMRVSAVRKLRSALGGLEGRVVGVWGVAFKGGTEDVRESPTVEVITLLLNEGAAVRAYDPSGVPEAPQAIRDLLSESPLQAVTGADALAVLADWPEFARVPLDDVWAAMHGSVLFDGRNVLDPDEARRRGFTYVGVGRQ